MVFKRLSQGLSGIIEKNTSDLNLMRGSFQVYHVVHAIPTIFFKGESKADHMFRKRQNLYYVKVQERLSTLDASEDYIMTVTSITGNCKVLQYSCYYYNRQL